MKSKRDSFFNSPCSIKLIPVLCIFSIKPNFSLDKSFSNSEHNLMDLLIISKFFKSLFSKTYDSQNVLSNEKSISLLFSISYFIILDISSYIFSKLSDSWAKPTVDIINFFFSFKIQILISFIYLFIKYKICSTPEV